MLSRSHLLLFVATAVSGAIALLACGNDAAIVAGQDKTLTVDGSTRITDRPDAEAEPPDASSTDSSADATSCEAYGEALCARLTACKPAYFIPGVFVDNAACVARHADRCTLERAAPGVDVVATGACAAQTKAQSCDEVLGRVPAPACRPPGSLSKGSGCASDLQCASGFCATNSTGCGTCSAPPKIGDPCVSGRCGTGDACTGPFGDNTCAAKVNLGAACGAESKAMCRFGLGCVNGQCTEHLPEGAPCKSGTTSGSPTCDDGYLCNGFTAASKCVKPKLVGVGEKCGFNAYQTDAGLMFDQTLCLGDGRCPYEQSGSTCQALGGEGDACQFDDDCLAELQCSKEGKCGYGVPSACP